MKQFYLRLMSLLALFAVTLGAKAADDFSYTIEWNNPGSVTVVLGGISDAPLSLDADATSYTVKQTGYVYIRPAAGYIIKSVKDQAGNIYKTSGYQNYGGQYASISCYDSKNGYVFTVETEKLVKTGEIEIDVVNGAERLNVYLENKGNLSMSTFHTPQIVKGVQKVDLTAYDNELVIEKTDNSGEAFYSIKKNGQNVAASTFATIDVADGDKIEIRTYENEIVIEKVDVEFVFEDGADGCLSSVFNRSSSKMITMDAIRAAGGKVTFEKGQELQFNFNEDFDILSVTSNGKALDIPAEGTAMRTTVNENTVFRFSAAAKVYTDIESVIYISGPVEGIVTRTGIMDDDVDIPLSGGETITEDVVFSYSNGKSFRIKAGTAKKYTLMVPGKSKKYFYEAKPGYWISEAILGNPIDPDYNYASAAVTAEESPLFISVETIQSNTHAIVFYDGEDSAARFYAQNTSVAGRIEVEGLEGQYLPNGYTEIGFDPGYHQSFSVGKAGGIDTNEIVAYLDGRKLTYDEDNMAYTGIILKEGSVLKVFSVKSGSNAQLHTVKFTADAGLTADVTYDMVKTHGSLSQSLQCIGKTLVSVKPTAGAVVSLDGEALEANADGCFEFMTSKSKHTVAITTASGIEEIEGEAAQDSRIYNLQGVEMKKDLDSLPAGIYIQGGKKIIKK